MVTPVPIPNTAVKHRSGEGIGSGRENSAPPGFFLLGHLYSDADVDKVVSFVISAGSKYNQFMKYSFWVLFMSLSMLCFNSHIHHESVSKDASSLNESNSDFSLSVDV